MVIYDWKIGNYGEEKTQKIDQFLIFESYNANGGDTRMPYKLLVVDDETMLTELLYEHFNNNGYIVYVANCSDEAFVKLRIQPDLIILDINIPGKDGMELCKEIRNHVACPILFLTARITEQDKVNGFRAGGDDYITKPFSLKEMSARVEAHLRRDRRNKTSHEIQADRGLIVNSSSRTAFWSDIEILFSKREFDVLEFLLSHPGQVFTKEQIYEAIWGFDAEGDSSVLKEHIRKIRAKLYEAAGQEFIETIWGMGYKWKR